MVNAALSRYMFLLFMVPALCQELDFSDMSLDDLLNLEVEVASNVLTDRSKQPVSITTISAQQIRQSGARTLMEVLNMYVPGFFHVQDQDDNIVGFRGIAPDNNSKVMFLLNGHNLNTEWFLGVPDGMINGINLDYIQHIDIIRGPGSVTLGQGALLGVINVVTKVGNLDGTVLTANTGQDEFIQGSIETGQKRGISPLICSCPQPVMMAKTYGRRAMPHGHGKGLRAITSMMQGISWPVPMGFLVWAI